MPFPAKFRALIETAGSEAAVPEILWLSYALCCAEPDSCGWSGWIIEAAIKDGRALKAADNQRCPDCGKQTFRTGLEKQYELSVLQPPKLDYSYKTLPITYDDEVDGTE